MKVSYRFYETETSILSQKNTPPWMQQFINKILAYRNNFRSDLSKNKQIELIELLEFLNWPGVMYREEGSQNEYFSLCYFPPALYGDFWENEGPKLKTIFEAESKKGFQRALFDERFAQFLKDVNTLYQPGAGLEKARVAFYAILCNQAQDFVRGFAAADSGRIPLNFQFPKKANLEKIFNQIYSYSSDPSLKNQKDNFFYTLFAKIGDLDLIAENQAYLGSWGCVRDALDIIDSTGHKLSALDASLKSLLVRREKGNQFSHTYLDLNKRDLELDSQILEATSKNWDQEVVGDVAPHFQNFYNQIKPLYDGVIQIQKEVADFENEIKALLAQQGNLQNELGTIQKISTLEASERFAIEMGNFGHQIEPHFLMEAEKTSRQAEVFLYIQKLIFESYDKMNAIDPQLTLDEVWSALPQSITTARAEEILTHIARHFSEPAKDKVQFSRKAALLFHPDKLLSSVFNYQAPSLNSDTHKMVSDYAGKAYQFTKELIERPPDSFF